MSMLANLLMTLGQMMQGDSEDKKDDCNVLKISPEDLVAKVIKAPNIEVEEPAIEPEPAVNDAVPLSAIAAIEQALSVEADPSDLTFWFKDLKWQLLKYNTEDTSPPAERPKASNHISSSMQYMRNLLGVNSETNEDVDDLSFRFVHEGNVYKIVHVFTGSHVRPVGAQKLDL